MHRSLSRAASTLAVSLSLAMVAAGTAAAQTKPGGSVSGSRTLGPSWDSAASAARARRSAAGSSTPSSASDMGGGMLGIEAGFDYYSWSNAFYSWKYIPVGVTANYHFKLDDPKIDPFLGAGLGYRVITCSSRGAAETSCSNSAIYFIGRAAAARYFFSPRSAVYADAGAGAPRSTSA